MTLVEVYDRLAANRPGDPAVIFDRSPHVGTILTWRSIQARSLGLAEHLQQGGLRSGRRCAVMLADHPDTIPLLLAVWRIGGVVIPVDPMWGESLVGNVVRHSGTDVIFDVRTGSLTPTAAGSNGRDAVSAETAMISYTSGSTAAPKGVVLRHRHLLEAYRAGAVALRGLLSSTPKRFGCAMRMSGLGVLGVHYLWSAVLGADVVVLPELNLANAREFWSGCERHRIDVIYLVPPLVDLLSRLAIGSAPHTSVTCISGGAPLSQTNQDRFQDRFDALLLNAYGLTETSFAVFFGSRDAAGRGLASIGLPAAGRARLVGPNGSDDDGSGPGELQLTGPSVCDGYYDSPVSTSKLFQDGWLRTGDLASRDEQGQYRIVGRLKEAVMKGAFTIYLSDIEEAACSLRGIAEAAAVRIDLPSGGEDVGLIVVAIHGETVRNVAGQLALMLGRQRAPRRVVYSPQPLPRVGQGKLDRRLIAELWHQLAGSGVRDPHADEVTP